MLEPMSVVVKICDQKSMNLTTRELRPPSFIQVEIYFLLLLFSFINVIIFSFLIYKILLSKILIVHVSKIYCFVTGGGVVVIASYLDLHLCIQLF